MDSMADFASNMTVLPNRRVRNFQSGNCRVVGQAASFVVARSIGTTRVQFIGRAKTHEAHRAQAWVPTEATLGTGKVCLWQRISHPRNAMFRRHQEVSATPTKARGKLHCLCTEYC